MKVINIYTDKIYKVYHVEVVNRTKYMETLFLIYDEKNGWMLVNAHEFAPYDETTIPMG